MSFVHLHLHTEYSLLDGFSRLAPLLDRVQALGMEAAAITDHSNMFGAVEFYRQAVKRGIKPILGSEVYVAPGSRRDRSRPPKGDEDEAAGNHHLILLVQNQAGYRNLCRLLSLAYSEGLYYKPRIDREILAECSAGLIALSGCMSGELIRLLRGSREAEASGAAQWYARTFPGRFYVELQANALHGEYNGPLKHLATRLGLPVVATNDCHYIDKGDSAAHDILLCVQTGKTRDDPKRWRFHTDELYVKSPAEMESVFGAGSEALRSTLEIARRVDFEFNFGVFRLPAFRDEGGQPVRGSEAAELFERRARAGLEERLAGMESRGGCVDRAAYQQRLEREIPVIREMGFSGYLLIVADFIDYARRQGIPVGPGRGSVVGSLASWALGITQPDPLDHGLLFERWLNPGRRSLPDIDVDFCFNRRDEVVEYVRRRYGAAHVAQIATFGTLKGKQAIKDVGRALGMSFAETDAIAKLYPAARQGRDFPLFEALKIDPRLAKERERRPELFKYAMALEGLARHASRHAAGIVISDQPLTELTPLYLEKSGAAETLPVTQYSMKPLEELGLVKFDFLGLRNLTLINNALRLITEGSGVPPDITHLPLNDPEVFKLLSSGDTTGVFQMDSSGMRRFLGELRPEQFEDIVAALALFRPGPLDAVQEGKTMAQHYIDRKHGGEEVQYDHPLLKPVLGATYGVFVYQEQVMEAARVLAGYTLEEADNLRAAMGKKQHEAMKREHRRFIEGAQNTGIARPLAEAIFGRMETFASYGFNRSHAVAYAFTTYATAYLKAHHPLEFMAALLSADIGDPDATYANVAALRTRNITLEPPDVNRSLEPFTVDGGAVRLGLGAVRGLGPRSASAIIAARHGGGPFTGLADFCARTRIDRKALEMLIKGGAFDWTGTPRAALARQVEAAIARAKDAHSGEFDFAAGGTQAAGGEGEWAEADRLRYEKDALGLYVTGHPLRRYRRDIEALAVPSLAALRVSQPSARARAIGVIQAVQAKHTKGGKRYATFSLEDMSGQIEVIAWPETYEKNEKLIAPDTPVAITGKLESREDRAQLTADEVVEIEKTLCAAAGAFYIEAPKSHLEGGALDSLRDKLLSHHGPVPVVLNLICDDRTIAVLQLGDTYRVAPNPKLRAEMIHLFGEQGVFVGRAPSAEEEQPRVVITPLPVKEVARDYDKAASLLLGK